MKQELCKHHTKQIAEREFFNNGIIKQTGTRIICLRCGKNKFIKDNEKRILQPRAITCPK